MISHALLFQKALQHARRHVVGVLIDVNELRDRARLRNRFRSGYECVRHGDYYVARLDPAGHNAKSQRIRAAADGDRVARIAEESGSILKLFDYPPTHAACTAKPPSK